MLDRLVPGDIVVLDNLGAHKVAGIAEAIHAAGVQLFYPPSYSPNYIPIERVFTKLKILIRKASTRTMNALRSAMSHLIYRFTPDECAPYIHHAGYGRPA